MTTVSAALPDDAPHLLVVDDDRRIRDLLSRFLFAEGYRVTTAETAADARAKLEGLRFDLLILDVMMPGETGFELARDLRAASSVPIIMLTARDEARQPDRGPDHRRRRLRQQAVRAEASFRCASPASCGAPVRPRRRRWNRCASAISVSISCAASSSAARRPSASPTASATCCALLAATPGETVPRQALAGNGGATGERAVDVQVNRLRRKIERDPANPLLVQTVRGIGYRLVTTP